MRSKNTPGRKGISEEGSTAAAGCEVCSGEARDRKKGLEPSWNGGGPRRRSYSSTAVKSQEGTGTKEDRRGRMTGPRIEPNVGSAGLCISVYLCTVRGHRYRHWTCPHPHHFLATRHLPPCLQTLPSPTPIFLPSCHQTALCNKQILPSHSLFPGLKTLDGNLQDKIRTQLVSPGPSRA